MPSDVSMYLDDPEKSGVLGIPSGPNQKPINNPFYHATELERTGDHKGSERILVELLNNEFDNPVLLAALGMNYAMQEKNGLAQSLLQRALERLPDMFNAFKRLGVTIKPDAVLPTGMDYQVEFNKVKRSEILNAIGTCYKHENHIPEARQYFEEAQAGIAINADIQNNLGTLYINEGKPELCFKYLDAAIAAQPDHDQAHWNRSLAYLELGDYERGWPEYDFGLSANVRVDRNYTPPGHPPLPVWRGEKNAKVVVYGEQGIGDEILFASMLPQLIADTDLCVFECHRKLHKLFSNSFPGIDIYPTREDEMVAWPVINQTTPRYPFTHKIALGSLGRFYRQSLDKFPGTSYLSPTPESELHWNELLAALPSGPRIGISWIGGHKKTRMEVRSVTLESLLPILSQNAQFISLQYTPQEEEIEAFQKAHPGIKIHYFPDACYSPIYDDTAGLVANLDLVITVCTSAVHLAGSMGVPTWVMTPSRPAWRYRLDLDTMPWYQNTLLFRQAPDSQDWEPVIADVAENLKLLLGAQDVRES